MTPNKWLLEINMTKIRLFLLKRIHSKHKNYEKVVEKLPKKHMKSLLICRIFQYKNCGFKLMENAAPVFLVLGELRYKSPRTKKVRVQGFINVNFVRRSSALLRVSADIQAKPITE